MDSSCDMYSESYAVDIHTLQVDVVTFQSNDMYSKSYTVDIDTLQSDVVKFQSNELTLLLDSLERWGPTLSNFFVTFWGATLGND
jgi:hypothetical protein